MNYSNVIQNELISSLFNLSIDQSIVPSSWKLSNVVPIPKNGPKNHAESFRPISLLSVFSKMLEKHIQFLLSEHFTNNSWWSFLVKAYWLATSVLRLLGFFYCSFSPSIDSQIFLSLYKAHVLPILEYKCAVWDPHLTKNIEKLENVQKFGFRIPYKLWSSKFNPYSSYNMPTLANRIIYLKLLLTYKRFHGFFYCPSSLLFFPSKY